MRGNAANNPELTDIALKMFAAIATKKGGEGVLGGWEKGGKRLDKVKRALKRVSLRRTKGVEF